MRLALALYLTLLQSAAFAQETRIVTDGFGAEITVPVNPQRIVALDDAGVVVPLLELGVVPVGSRARGSGDDIFIRGAELLLGMDFDNTTIQPVGDFPPDLEAIAALEPDLIIGYEYDALEQLRQIAPVYAINYGTTTANERYEIIADLTGTQDQLEFLKRRYNAQLERIREIIDVENTMVSTLHATASDGFFAYNPYLGIGEVLIDAGFDRPDALEALPRGESVTISPERIQDFDADFIISTYRYTRGVTPEAYRGYFENAFPGYCELLHACRTGQMYVVPRADFSGTSYTARSQQALALLTIIAGQEFELMPR